MSKAINTKLLCCWTVLCIFGCGSLPDMVMSARYLPTRRSIPTKLERDERLREFFEHVSETDTHTHTHNLNKYRLKYSKEYILIQRMDCDSYSKPTHFLHLSFVFVSFSNSKISHTRFWSPNGMHIYQQPANMRISCK